MGIRRVLFDSGVLQMLCFAETLRFLPLASGGAGGVIVLLQCFILTRFSLRHFGVSKGVSAPIYWYV